MSNQQPRISVQALHSVIASALLRARPDLGERVMVDAGSENAPEIFEAAFAPACETLLDGYKVDDIHYARDFHYVALRAAFGAGVEVGLRAAIAAVNGPLSQSLPVIVEGALRHATSDWERRVKECDDDLRRLATGTA